MRPPQALIGLVLIATAACTEPNTGGPNAAGPLAVQVSAVHRGNIREVMTVTGETAALSVLRLASPIAGRVTFLSAQPGDRLEANAVAARVISLENDAALHGFAFLAGAAAFGAHERDRAERLQHDLRAAAIPLRVPFAAVVAERLRNPDEQVAANDVLLELFDPASLYALAQVPIAAAADLHVGLPAEVRTGSASVTGHVIAITATIAPQTLTVPVRVQLAAPMEPPLLHAALEIRITLEQHANALLIPRTALLSSNVAAEGTVMVATGNRAHRRTVQLGLRSASEIEVTGGLTDSEVVLTDGQYALPDDTVIEPVFDAESR